MALQQHPTEKIKWGWETDATISAMPDMVSITYYVQVTGFGGIQNDSYKKRRLEVDISEANTKPEIKAAVLTAIADDIEAG